jgi:hypothetical protein
LDQGFFKLKPEKLAGTQEYGLPQTLAKFASIYPLRVVKTKTWIEVNNHSDLKRAQSHLKMN